MEIKNNLQKYRTWKNIKQKDLAEILKIGMFQLREIEKYNHYPKYQIRSRICEYFNVKQDQMFYIEGEE